MRATVLLLLLAIAQPVHAEAMRVEEALALALRANPDVRASLLDVVVARETARAARQARVPVLRAGLDGSYRESFSGTASGAVRNSAQGITSSLGLGWTSEVGTTVDLDLSASASWRRVNRDPSTTTSFSIGPNYDAQLIGTIRQPLLRGRGRDAVLADQRAAEAGEAAASATRDADVSGVVRDILEAYWEVWYAARALNVQSEARALAERQLADAQTQVELGTLAVAERLQYASSLAGLRESERSAAQTFATRRLALAQLLAASPESLDVVLDAPDAPELDALRSLLASAEARSPQLLALQASVEQAERNAEAARNAARARVDLVGSAGLVTLWADDDLSGAQLPNGRPGFIVTGGLEIELPLGSSAAHAQRSGAEARVELAEARQQSGVLTVRTSVRTAFENASSAGERVPLARETADIAEQLAEAERERARLGTNTTRDVLEAQQKAREAELQWLRTLIDAVTAAHTVEHHAGVLLDRFSIVNGDSHDG